MKTASRAVAVQIVTPPGMARGASSVYPGRRGRQRSDGINLTLTSTNHEWLRVRSWGFEYGQSSDRRVTRSVVDLATVVGHYATCWLACARLA